MDSTVRTHSSSVPAELCGYRIDRALADGQCYLAAGADLRRVVLKRVDEDCLLGTQLHPSIKERLARVRELAHGGVANLHGVCREEEAAWLIWEYVEGQTFDEYLAEPDRTAVDVLNLARELILAVDALHGQGIVHGALTGTNVIVKPEGALRLTHISPLLYTEMEVDVECVVSMLHNAVERCAEQSSPLGRILDNTVTKKVSLRGLATRISALLEVRADVGLPEVRGEERHIRRRTFLAAGIVGMLGLAIAYGIWRITDGSAEFRPARWLTPSSTPVK